MQVGLSSGARVGIAKAAGCGHCLEPDHRIRRLATASKDTVMAAEFDLTQTRSTLFAALLQAMHTHGAAKVILDDPERQPLTYGRLVLGAMVLGAELAKGTRRGETVGVLLPNVVGLPVVIFGLNAFGRVPAMLNFSAGVKNVRSALRTGVIRRLITSRRFVTMGNLQPILAELAKTEVAPGKTLEIIYLEDVRKHIGLKEKIVGAVRAKFARRVHQRLALGPDQPAVVLFTSGTEGNPKGVVLTNANLLANAQQIIVHADRYFSSADIVLNPLPIFHSYGLTAGTLMPLLNGMKCVLYPSPLHYKEIPKLIGATKATILFGTDTFLQAYARAAEPGDLKSVKFVIAGAEKVKDTTKATWSKFGTTILEGYGATECAPVIACTLPHAQKSGSVGMVLPGQQIRIEPVAGIPLGGRLHVKGPNVMAGYFLADTPGVLVPTQDGWHDTGDIVEVDADGLMSITGRAKRFAKVGGEMISLAAVEGMLASLWPENNHVVLSVPDAKRGEQLILVTDRIGADRGALQAAAKAEGIPELWVPRAITIVPEIPVLASGKVDLMAAAEMLRTSRAAASAD
jgi:acyl-[acyl-carrier-protein]-phospholipid O-acyltransferase / long-chain-fatty-acid--[acyl-carrier-protein] ligase